MVLKDSSSLGWSFQRHVFVSYHVLVQSRFVVWLYEIVVGLTLGPEIFYHAEVLASSAFLLERDDRLFGLTESHHWFARAPS